MKNFLQYIIENINKVSLDNIEKIEDKTKKLNALRLFLVKQDKSKSNSYSNRKNHPKEILRGSFGKKDEFENNLRNFLEQCGLESNDFSIKSADGENISSSFYSLKVNWKGLEFIVCNNSVSKKGNNINISKEDLSPVKLGICGKDYKSSKEIINDIKDKIKDEQLKEFLTVLLNDLNKDKLSADKGGNYIYNLPDNLKNYWNEKLSTEAKNNIQTSFGEIICAVASLNIYNEYDHIFFPDDVSNFFSDFYLASKPEGEEGHMVAGCSVKSTSSSYGHKPSVRILFTKLLNNYNDIKEQIKQTDSSISDEEFEKFEKITKLFYSQDEKESKTNKQYDIIWGLINQFNSIQENPSINSIKEVLGKSISDEKSLAKRLIELSEDEESKLFNNLKSLSNGKLNNEYSINKETSNWKENTSKVMVYLTFYCVDKLNELFGKENPDSSKEKEYKSIFNLILNYYLNTKKQFIINFKYNEDKLNIIFNIKEAKNVKIVFHDAGITSNNWNGHGTIGFKFI